MAIIPCSKASLDNMPCGEDVLSNELPQRNLALVFAWVFLPSCVESVMAAKSGAAVSVECRFLL